MPKERRGMRREVLFRDQRHPLLIRLLSHDPLLCKTNGADGFFPNHLCIGQIPLHWFWQAEHLGFRDETRLCLLTVLQQLTSFVAYRTVHCSSFSSGMAAPSRTSSSTWNICLF